jgi:hypothetical protein
LMSWRDTLSDKEKKILGVGKNNPWHHQLNPLN